MMNQTLDVTLHSCSSCGSEWVMENQELGLLQVSKNESIQTLFLCHSEIQTVDTQHDTQDFILSDSGASNEGSSLAIQRFAFTPTREGREVLTFKY